MFNHSGTMDRLPLSHFASEAQGRLLQALQAFLFQQESEEWFPIVL
jgi:hypothetical protein